MRVRSQQIRVLAGIAMQRLQERDLRTLHEMITQLSPLAFVELIRDIEDEIESALAVGFSSIENENSPDRISLASILSLNAFGRRTSSFQSIALPSSWQKIYGKI